MLWDGGAKSVDPNCLMSGPVGEKIKALPDNLLPFVDFKKIKATIPIVNPKILENQDVKNMAPEDFTVEQSKLLPRKNKLK